MTTSIITFYDVVFAVGRYQWENEPYPTVHSPLSYSVAFTHLPIHTQENGLFFSLLYIQRTSDSWKINIDVDQFFDSERVANDAPCVNNTMLFPSYILPLFPTITAFFVTIESSQSPRCTTQKQQRSKSHHAHHPNTVASIDVRFEQW